MVHDAAYPNSSLPGAATELDPHYPAERPPVTNRPISAVESRRQGAQQIRSKVYGAPTRNALPSRTAWEAGAVRQAESRQRRSQNPRAGVSHFDKEGMIEKLQALQKQVFMQTL